jgi:hypothetical protein
MKKQIFSLLELENYINSIKVPLSVLLVFNLLYIALGFSTIAYFSQGISALFSVVGFIGFFVPLAAYSVVTWNIIRHKGTALDSAVAGALLSLSVFVASELIGFITTSLMVWNIVPESVVSASLRAHFIDQYLNILNVALGLIFGLVIAFIGGFFGFIISEIQSKFVSRAKSIILKENKTKRTKSLAKDVKIFAALRTRKSLKDLISYLKQMMHN